MATVAMTGAVNPGLEDIALSVLPGMPRVHIRNPVIGYENGDDMMQRWCKAENGEIDPFVLITEGSVPNEEAIKGYRGYWAAMGTRGPFGQPITTNEWLGYRRPFACNTSALA